MPENPDACVPQAVTDFLFDLYDSVTLSQRPDEQTTLYTVDLPDLSQKYFATSPWPSPTSIACECNGDPFFLAVYRELTHRHWHSISRPTVTDRMEGWDVYRELFDEILDATPNFFLVGTWVFEILFEFVYQFQGYCQIKTAVYSTAQKHGLLDAEGNFITDHTGAVPSKHSTLADNWQLLQSNTDAWDIEAVYSYLHRFIERGRLPKNNNDKSQQQPAQPVDIYFSLFASIALSRLECLLGDYTASLKALDVVTTVCEVEPVVLQSVVAAKVSLAYHAGISYLQLRRYRDATAILLECASSLQQGFKTGTVRHDQFHKQYERMLALLAVLYQICPGVVGDSRSSSNGGGGGDEAVWRAVREKHGSKIETASSSLEEWFQSPKFIAADPAVGAIHRQQVDMFNREMKPVAASRNLRSYLKLYTSLPVQKLANFHDVAVPDFLPTLLYYKARMFQKERGEGDSYSAGKYQSALDIQYYVEQDTVFVDEAEMQRRFETYFVGQIAQTCEIRQDVLAIDLAM